MVHMVEECEAIFVDVDIKIIRVVQRQYDVHLTISDLTCWLCHVVLPCGLKGLVSRGGASLVVKSFLELSKSDA